VIFITKKPILNGEPLDINRYQIYGEQDFGITILCNSWYGQNAIWKNISKEIIKLYLIK
jgi:hypothetical protein